MDDTQNSNARFGWQVTTQYRSFRRIISLVSMVSNRPIIETLAENNKLLPYYFKVSFNWDCDFALGNPDISHIRRNSYGRPIRGE